MQLDIVKLSKHYNFHRVFDNWSHTFQPGHYGIVGPNGVGKSTLLAILAGAEEFQGGQVLLDDRDLQKQGLWYKQHVGYCPDHLQFYPILSVNEFLQLAATIKRCQLPDPEGVLIGGFNVASFLNTALGELSLGTRKKILLIAALMNQPKVLLLDEPTDELDKNSKAFLIDILRANHDAIVIISTHDEVLLQSLDADVIALDKPNAQHPNA